MWKKCAMQTKHFMITENLIGWEISAKDTLFYEHDEPSHCTD